MNDLDNEQKKLLADLSMSPVWSSLMRIIDDDKVPGYKKGKDTEQVNDWVYQSGVVAGKQYVLKLLRYDNERQA